MRKISMYLNISKIRNSLMGIAMIMITIIGANIYKCIVNKAIKSKVLERHLEVSISDELYDEIRKK